MKPQVVIDTNVVVAGLGSRRGASAQILNFFEDGDIDVHVSVPVLLQYEDVLSRAWRKINISREDVTSTLAAFAAFGIRHDIKFLFRDVLPDKFDAAFLELAIAAQVPILVTHNVKHFKGITAFGIRALKPIEFLVYVGDLP